MKRAGDKNPEPRGDWDDLLSHSIQKPSLPCQLPPRRNRNLLSSISTHNELFDASERLVDFSITSAKFINHYIHLTCDLSKKISCFWHETCFKSLASPAIALRPIAQRPIAQRPIAQSPALPGRCRPAWECFFVYHLLVHFFLLPADGRGSNCGILAIVAIFCLARLAFSLTLTFVLYWPCQEDQWTRFRLT
jgi:hypothetical protein